MTRAKNSGGVAGRIEPDRLYQESELVLELGFAFSRLQKARRNEGLRYEDLAHGRRGYMGEWLLRWLNRDREGVNDGG